MLLLLKLLWSKKVHKLIADVALVVIPAVAALVAAHKASKGTVTA